MGLKLHNIYLVMDFPSHISEVSDICGDLNDFVEEDVHVVMREPVKESPFNVFLKAQTPLIFSQIFPKLNILRIDCELAKARSYKLTVSFISNYKLHVLVYSLLKLSYGHWSVRFEPLLCSPMNSEINWIRFAYVTFEPAFYDYERNLKNWLEQNGDLFEDH